MSDAVLAPCQEMESERISPSCNKAATAAVVASKLHEVQNRFKSQHVSKSQHVRLRLQVVRNQAGTGANDLALGADAPLWSAATVPLADEAGKPLPPSHVGEAGHAMSLSDQQVCMVCTSCRQYAGICCVAVSLSLNCC